ncbi:Uncharacterised protein [Vibrio cholerae]|nr:Uncharacterised protein [Vibrio cholerae]
MNFKAVLPSTMVSPSTATPRTSACRRTALFNSSRSAACSFTARNNTVDKDGSAKSSKL